MRHFYNIIRIKGIIMKNKLLGLALLTTVLFAGCAQHQVDTKSSKNVAVTKIESKRSEKFLNFNLEVIKKVPVNGWEENKKEIKKEIFQGSINLEDIDNALINKDENSPQHFIYKDDKKIPYVIGKMSDEKGNLEEMESTVDKGIYFYMIERVDNPDNIPSKFLVINIKDIADWKKTEIENEYGAKETLLLPETVNIKQLVYLPVKNFSMTAIHSRDGGDIALKINLSETKGE